MAKPLAHSASEDQPVLLPGYTMLSATDKICGIAVTRPPGPWYLGFLLASGLVMVLITALTYLFLRGVGIWGINIPVGWGFAIVNFVWWIGIGHAGTLISAILLLVRQDWRTSINRLAEAMTLFAVACAGLFPLLHLGRQWRFYYILPYPDSLQLWPQWRSPLVWDVFAVTTYFTVSLIFWYIGVIPDLATMRDRADRRFSRRAFGVFALGWRNSARHWHRYKVVYLLLAGLATPLVVSVHSVVSLDFTVAIVPGWHSTIFPPYFVAGAIYSGFAMVVTLIIPLRRLYGLHPFITGRHLEVMAKLMLVTGLIVAYGYIMELFLGGFYSNDTYERYMTGNRAFGPYRAVWWELVACNVVIPQLLWFRSFRVKPIALFCIAMSVNVGMWAERYVIVVTSLHRDHLPSSWGMYSGSLWDWATFAGSIGLFLVLFFLFARFIPTISVFELRELIHEEEHRRAVGHVGHGDDDVIGPGRSSGAIPPPPEGG